MYNLRVDEATFCILDLETTSLSPETGEIIEIAAIKYQGNLVTNKFSTLIKPDIEFIPPKITALTGISTAMVIDQPKITDIFEDFLKFVGDSIIVAHNAKFDMSFLNYKSKELYGKNLKNPVLCTCNLSRRLFPELKSKSLPSMAYYFNIPFNQKHRAMSDAEATLEIFKKMMEILQDYNINRVIDIIKLAERKNTGQSEKRRRYVQGRNYWSR